MKILYLLTLFMIFTGCAHNSPTILSFSSEFKVSLPSSFFSGGTIFSIDELSVKSIKGELISGGVISADSEGLPSGFNMVDYPSYLLKIKTPDDNLLEAFKNSTGEIDYTYNISSLKVDESLNFKIYSLCKNNSCLAYSVKKGFQEHILVIHSRGLSRDKFVTLIKGDLNAKY